MAVDASAMSIVFQSQDANSVSSNRYLTWSKVGFHVQNGL